jgi:two-component system, cell cycle sensor histidine kinase and response regulator CckA
MRARSFVQLTGHTAHDIANMMTIVLTYADQLSSKLSRGDPAHHDVREIRSAAERVGVLTRELLRVARDRSSPPAALDLHDVLAGVSDRLRTVVGPRVRVELSLRATHPLVFGDRLDLEQTLISLADNARDAMPDGGLLSLMTEDASGIEARVGGDGRAHVALTVRDTGEGMDDATKRRAFEPFFSTKSPERGSGLGLSLVAMVVQTMGGAIVVDSAAGQGAAIRIVLPVAS